jgi:hypothetical protein
VWVLLTTKGAKTAKLIALLRSLRSRFFNTEFWEYTEYVGVSLLLNTLAQYCFWVGFAADYGDYGDFWDFALSAVLIGVFFVGDSSQIIPCGMGELDVARFARVF